MRCRDCCVAWIAVLVLRQTTLAALSFNITYVDDANGTLASRGWLDPQSLFQQNIRAAANIWGSRFNSNATIVMRVDTVSFSARAGGTNTTGRLLYTNAAGKKVWEFGPLTRILTGSNPGATTYGYDIKLGFDVQYTENNWWIDPHPTLRTDPVPSNKGDFMSVVLHEMGHGFGMTGYRDFPTGQILGPDATQFDDKSYFGGNGNPVAPSGARNPMYFRGNSAAALFGRDLSLVNKPPGDFHYSQNYFHLSACDSAAPDGLEGTLMNGCVLPNGQRMTITPYDLAVYADIGYPVVNLPGDFNKNGIVDGADYVVWRNTMGDATSYNLWRTHFGQTYASGSALSENLTVPEPGTPLLLLAGLLMAFSLDGCSHWRFSVSTS
jgi:hypothetical protein